MIRSTFFALTILLASALAAVGQTVPPEIAAANKDIAAAMQKNDLKGAAVHARKAVGLVEAHFGSDSRHTALSYENLGTILAADGKHKHAIEPLHKALTIFRKDLKTNASDAAGVLGKLGEAHMRAGQLKDAESIFTEFRSEAQVQFGADSREMIRAKLALACFYLNSREDVKAMDELVDAYAIAVNKFGRESAELDQAGGACKGSLVNLFWSNQKRLEPARKRLNDLLGYQMGKPVSVRHADVPGPIPWKPIDVVMHWVVVKVWIDEKGNPTKSKLVWGGEKFADLGTNAAKESRYQASIKDGKPISDVMYLSFSFAR